MVAASTALLEYRLGVLMVRPRDVVVVVGTLGCATGGLGMMVGWLLGVRTGGTELGGAVGGTLGSWESNGLGAGVTVGGTLGCGEGNIGDGMLVGWILGALGLYLKISCS